MSLPVLTLQETVAEKLRTLLQRRRPTDLSDLALVVCDYGDQLDRAHVRGLAHKKFTLVKQGDRRARIEANVEEMRATYVQTISGLAPGAPSFADAQRLVIDALPDLAVLATSLAGDRSPGAGRAGSNVWGRPADGALNVRGVRGIVGVALVAGGFGVEHGRGPGARAGRDRPDWSARERGRCREAGSC